MLIQWPPRLHIKPVCHSLSGREGCKLPPRHVHLLHLTMGDLTDSNSIDDRVLSVVPRREEDIKVVFHKVGDDDDDEYTTERIHLQSNSHDERGNDKDARTRTMESSAMQRFCPLIYCRIGGGGDPISTDAGDTVAKGSLQAKTREHLYNLASYL